VRLRFLVTTASQRPEFPFQAGQEIVLTGLTPEVQSWLRGGLVVVVPEESEAAVVVPTERAVLPKANKKRGARGDL
jgi:hypothetical protein